MSEAPKNGKKILAQDANGDFAVIWWDCSYPNKGDWVYAEVQEDYINSWLYFYPVAWCYLN
jgi:hypothetical protein